MRGQAFLSRPSLPAGVNIQQVYHDFIRLLYEAARDCLLLIACDGNGVWDRLKDAIVLVFVIPNAWDFEVQTIIRDAVGASNIGQSDIRFVTEAEAAVHIALGDVAPGRNHLPGGGCGRVHRRFDSIHLHGYSTTAHFEGGRFASKPAQFSWIMMEGLLIKRLHEVQFNMDDSPEVLSNLITSFKRDAKWRYDGTQERLLVDSGIFNLNHRGIVKSKLGLTNSEVKEVFDLPIGTIVAQCQGLVRVPDHPVSVRTFLQIYRYRVLKHHPAPDPCGWVGESRYLQRQLQEATPGVPVILPRDSS